MATASLLQDRENVGNNCTVAVDWIPTASPSILANEFVILRTGTVSGPIEILLRIASPNDLNVLNPNPLNGLYSSAWQYLYAQGSTPSSIRFDTVPETWQTTLNTTKFTDNAGAINSLVIPQNAFIRITGGYGSYSSGNPLLIPIAQNALSLANAINLAPPNYFPLGPTESTQTVTYSIGTSADLPNAYEGTLGVTTTGVISYQDTYNVMYNPPVYTYAPGTQLIPLFGQNTSNGKVTPAFFPACILNIPPPTTISGTQVAAQTAASASSTLSSTVPFLTSSNPFPTNISVWSDPDATGTKLTWNSGVNAITDAVIYRSDYGDTTNFIDSNIYSYFNSATTALAHSISVQSLVTSLLNQESQTLLVGGGSLLGVTGYNLTGS